MLFFSPEPSHEDIKDFIDEAERAYWDSGQGTPEERADLWQRLEELWRSIPDPTEAELEQVMGPLDWGHVQRGENREDILNFYRRKWKKDRKAAAREAQRNKSNSDQPPPTGGTRVINQTADDKTPLSKPTEKQLRRNRIQEAHSIRERADPDDEAEEEAEERAEAERYKRKLAEARERKAKEFESEFGKQDQPETVRPKAQSGLQGLRDEVDRAGKVMGEAADLLRRKTPSRQETTLSEKLLLVFTGLGDVLIAVIGGNQAKLWVSLVMLVAACAIQVCLIIKVKPFQSVRSNVGLGIAAVAILASLWWGSRPDVPTSNIGSDEIQHETQPSKLSKPFLAPNIAILPKNGITTLPILIAVNETGYFLPLDPIFTEGFVSLGNFTKKSMWYPAEETELRKDAGYTIEMASRGELKNYSESALLNLVMKYEVSFYEGTSNQGKLISHHTHQVGIPALEQGKPFVFYVVNQSPYYAEVDFPKEVELQVAGEPDRRKVPLLQAENIDQLLQNFPKGQYGPSKIDWKRF